MSENCNCPCCKPQEEENILKYSILELNRILNDVPINASMRYRSKSEDDPLILNLPSAVALVPERDRAPGKLLTFVDDNQEIEVWLFTGTTLDSFYNIGSWVQIYTKPSPGIHGGFSSFPSQGILHGGFSNTTY